MKPLPDFDVSFEAFFQDLALRSLDLREWILEVVGHADKDVVQGLVLPINGARNAIRTIFEKFWCQISENCFLDRKGQALVVEGLGYHPRFGWVIEAQGLRAHLGKPSLLEKVTIKIGNRSYLSGGALIRGVNRLEIGAFTSIAEGFYVNTFRDFHPLEYPSTYNFVENLRLREDGLALDIPYGFLRCADEKVTIGSDVWIGRNVRIFHGSCIGHGCVIAENSLVRGTLEPYWIYGGSPAKPIRQRFSDATIEALLALRWWEWSYDLIARNRRFFATDLTIFDGDILALIES